jgi:hypothetical protein
VRHQKEALGVYRRVRKQLLAMPNVIGVGAGLGSRGHGDDERHLPEACITVTVRRKGEFDHEHLLPRRIHGVRVDVQEGRIGRWKAGPVDTGLWMGAANSTERGRIGMVALQNGAPVLLTALHVIVRETADTQIPPGGGVVVESTAGGEFDSYAPVGKLTWGRFDAGSDVAIVALDPGVTPVPTSTADGLPLIMPPAGSTQAGAQIALRVGGVGTVTGYVSDLAYSGSFETDAGVLGFHDLLRFRINAASVESGWSGSLLYDANTLHPLSLLSFGSVRAPSTPPDAPVYGFGWLLRPHYDQQGLQLFQ